MRLILFLAILGPFLSGFDANTIDLTQINRAPSFTHFFGTDDLGRDLFTRCCVGARISIGIGCAAALIDCCIGALLGMTAGYLRVPLVMRLVDVVAALPPLLITLILIPFFNSSVIPFICVIALFGWIPMARSTFAHSLNMHNTPFILASEGMGASTLWILRKHLLPHTLPIIKSVAALTFATAIFNEAFLSFLGLGVPPPLASWGTLASEGLAALPYSPWRFFAPTFMMGYTLWRIYDKA